MCSKVDHPDWQCGIVRTTCERLTRNYRRFESWLPWPIQSFPRNRSAMGPAGSMLVFLTHRPECRGIELGNARATKTGPSPSMHLPGGHGLGAVTLTLLEFEQRNVLSAAHSLAPHSVLNAGFTNSSVMSVRNRRVSRAPKGANSTSLPLQACQRSKASCDRHTEPCGQRRSRHPILRRSSWGRQAA